MFFGARRKKSVQIAVAGGALVALALGTVGASAAGLDSGKFFVKAQNSPDPAFWGIYPNLRLGEPSPGSPEPTTPPTTDPGTPTPTPTPTTDPTTPPPTTPPAPAVAGDLIFNINTSVTGCSTSSRRAVFDGILTPTLKVVDPTGKSTEVSKTGSSATIPLTQSGEWNVIGEYNSVSFEGNSCVTDVTKWRGDNVNSAQFAFRNAANLKTIAEIPSKLTSTLGMLDGAKSFTGNVSSWKMGSVKDMSYMFQNATSFTGAGVESFDTRSLTTAGFMFAGATAFNANLGSWNTANLDRTNSMFSGATSFTGAGLENWKTPKLTTVGNMFMSASKFNANLGGWSVGNVTTFESMFSGAKAFTGEGIETWDVSKATSMNSMFKNASVFNGKVGQWKPSGSKLKDMFTTFNYAAKFDQDLSSWNLCNPTNTSWADGSPIRLKSAQHPKFTACTGN